MWPRWPQGGVGSFSTSRCVDNNFDSSEDPQTQQLLAGLVGLSHHLHNKWKLVKQLEGERGPWWLDHLHQSDSLPGKLLRFHESAGPPWFSQAHRCALVELRPDTNGNQENTMQVVSETEKWKPGYCVTLSTQDSRRVRRQVCMSEQNTSYILVFKNFLLRLMLDLWILHVIRLDSKLWPLHGQRVQALQHRRRKGITTNQL